MTSVLVSGCGGGVVGAGVDGGDGGLTADPDSGVANQPPDAGVPPRCTVTPDAVTCSARTTTLTAGTASREVFWQTPATTPPPAGYPVVVVYQGSFFGPSSTWGTVASDLPFAGYQQARLQAVLLERGFTVIAPSAAAGLAWQTNSGLPWDLTTDQPIIDALLDGIARGDFGPADGSRLYATGISSGGYMTSRMALSYAGRFRALAIHSASWATCAGAACLLPATLPADHPPTLFLHGRNDLTVPLFTAETYFERLDRDGFSTELVVDDDASHEWLSVAPERITAWFEGH
jgi:poly(3-hydroxybutyrate) depolymerase